jgi:hypothetical protein
MIARFDGAGAQCMNVRPDPDQGTVTLGMFNW